MDSIVQMILHIAGQSPEKTAIVHEDQIITYGQLSDQMIMFSNTVKEKKIKKGSRIAIEADPLISFFVAYLGCHLAGMVAVPIEKNISIYRLQEILKATKPVLIFFKDSGEKYEDYLYGQRNNCKIKYPKSDEVASIISTTGTTGNPVLVTHTHLSILAESENLAEGISLTEESILFTNISFVLAAGYRRVFATLCKGGTAVISNQDLSEALLGNIVDNYALTHISIVNSNLGFFLNLEEEELKKRIGKVSCLETVSGSLMSSQIYAFHKLYPSVGLYNVYGTTETGCLIYNNAIDNPTDHCLGKPTGHTEISIIDENGEKVEEANKYGYIAVKGPMNMKGYYRKKSLTEQIVFGDYIIMNDIAYFDEQGTYYFVSRVGDIIDVNGHKVLPTEIEQVALDYAGILDCACKAEKDKKFGNIPVLYVVCDEKVYDEGKFLQYLTAQLEAYKIPGEIIKTDSIPRTSTGKIMRRLLK